MKAFIVSLVLILAASYLFYFEKNLEFQTIDQKSRPILFKATRESIMGAMLMHSDGRQRLSQIIAKEDAKQDILIHFWATWCAPCLEELPLLYKYARTSKNTVFVFVAVNDSVEKVEKFLTQNKIEKDRLGYWLMDNDQETYRIFRVDKIPETYVLRMNGDIERLIGAQDWR